MEIKQKFMTKNRCYTSPKKITPKYLVLHSTGTPQPKNSAYFGNWNTSTAQVSIHGLIGSEGVWQTLPWDYRGWHVGSGKNGSLNGSSIGVEICEPSGFKYSGGSNMVGYDVTENQKYFYKVYSNAVELFAFLCNEFKLDPLTAILCHSEVHKIGYGSNHGDVMHWFPKHGKDMHTFRNDVKLAMGKKEVPKKITKNSPKDHILYIQKEFNKIIGANGYPKIAEDGVFGTKTRLATQIVWELWGWNKEGTSNGWTIGEKTINKIGWK